MDQSLPSISAEIDRFKLARGNLLLLPKWEGGLGPRCLKTVCPPFKSNGLLHYLRYQLCQYIDFYLDFISSLVCSNSETRDQANGNCVMRGPLSTIMLLPKSYSIPIFILTLLTPLCIDKNRNPSWCIAVFWANIKVEKMFISNLVPSNHYKMLELQIVKLILVFT